MYILDKTLFLESQYLWNGSSYRKIRKITSIENFGIQIYGSHYFLIITYRFQKSPKNLIFWSLSLNNWKLLTIHGSPKILLLFYDVLMSELTRLHSFFNRKWRKIFIRTQNSVKFTVQTFQSVLSTPTRYISFNLLPFNVTVSLMQFNLIHRTPTSTPTDFKAQGVICRIWYEFFMVQLSETLPVFYVVFGPWTIRNC